MWMMRKRQCTWTKLWSWIEGDGGWFKRKKWEKWQKEVGKSCFSISHEHAENSHNREKWNRMGFGCSTKRKKWKLISHDHAKFSHSHAKCSRKTKFVPMHFPFRTIMRNCWSSWEIVFFPDFLSEEASERPFRLCQVSTWPWPINKNLIYSFKDFFTFF